MNKKGVTEWLVLALLFLITAIIAGLYGFGYISGISLVIAKGLAVIFVILAIITIIARTIKDA